MLDSESQQRHLAFKQWLQKTNAVVAVSLSSGGAEAMGRDLALMEMITELNIPYHEVHGSSAGAPVGAVYAKWKVVPGQSDANEPGIRTIGELRRGFGDLARTPNLMDISRNALRTLRQTGKASAITGIFAGQRLESKIEASLEQGTFDDCVKDLYVYAETEEELGYEVFNRYTHPDVKLHEAIRASISIPYFFEPKMINEKNYIDGGLLVNTPLRVVYTNYLEKYNKKRPLVILASTTMYPYEEIKHSDNIWETVKNRYFYKILSRIFFMELAEILHHRNVFVMLFYPRGIERINSFGFSKMEEYLEANKPNFFALYDHYLSKMNLRKYRKKLSFRPSYDLDFMQE